MKKVLAIVAVLMLVPFTAFGMEMMADTALEDVTGQAGVSISIDNVQMDFELDYLSWGDGDGVGTTASTLVDGYINLSSIKMTGIVIDKYVIGNSGIDPIVAIVDSGFDPTVSGSLKYLTIDVGQIATSVVWDAATSSYVPNTSGTLDTAVKIGIPTLTVYVEKIDDITVSLSGDKPSYDATTGDLVIENADTLGVMAVGGMQLDTLGGNVYILAH